MSEYSLPASLKGLLEQKGLFEGKYRLVRFLGEGSFASVIHARHETMDRDVALKNMAGLSKHDRARGAVEAAAAKAW